MSERDEKSGGPGCAIGLVALLFLLLVLYVLGIGPATWMVGGNNPHRYWQAFYNGIEHQNQTEPTAAGRKSSRPKIHVPTQGILKGPAVSGKPSERVVQLVDYA